MSFATSIPTPAETNSIKYVCRSLCGDFRSSPASFARAAIICLTAPAVNTFPLDLPAVFTQTNGTSKRPSSLQCFNHWYNARMPEVEIKNAAIERANWVYLIADSSKWAVNTFASIAPIERCNCIVSDSALPKFAQHEIKRLGIALSLA
jgi:hypothetical protein